MNLVEVNINKLKTKGNDFIPFATVVDVNPAGDAKIIFVDETNPVDTYYATMVKVNVGDRVKVESVSGTYIITGNASTKGGVEDDVTKEYVDATISNAVSSHNTSSTAHSDIRTAITEGDKGLSDQLTVLKGKEIKSYGISDLDNFREFGIRLYSLNDVDGRSILHLPSITTYGYSVENIRTNESANYFVQELTMRKTTTLNNTVKFTRKCENGVFSDWLQIATTDKIDILWEGNTTNGTLTLTNIVSDYHAIVVSVQYGAGYGYTPFTIDRAPYKLQAGTKYRFPNTSTGYDATFSADGYSVVIANNTIPIRRIVGIKYGGR